MIDRGIDSDNNYQVIICNGFFSLKPHLTDWLRLFEMKDAFTASEDQREFGKTGH